MATSRVNEIPAARLREAIDIVASAEIDRRRAEELSEALGLELDVPRKSLQRQGLSATLDSAMGSVPLPALVDLHGALAEVRELFLSAPDLAPEMAETVTTVLDGEQMKLERYLQLMRT